ncbi:hypothetical protein LPJ56_004145 [Coemansia sp. RSA 2599]|nr:hypothetical protein LPJ56_004145 [Coemansia sp. RSA 2599]
MSSFADSLAAGNDEDMDYDEDNVGYKPSSSVLDDPFGGGANEGEDEMDVVIVDKAERAAFKQTRRKAMEESVELAQEEDEPSDWEREQLRNAGISLRLKTPKSAATAKLPEDSGGFSFDDAFVNMVISEEENQLNIEQGRLEKLQAQLQRSKEKALAVQNSLKQAEAQLDHFTSMAKTLQRQQ